MSLDSVLLRALVALGLAVLGVALYWAWNRYQLRRLGAARAGRLRGLEDFKPGVPGILYFTTPDCQVCLTTQRPALRRLEAEMGQAVQVIEVDATQRPDLADYWGVLSVPTTFIIDAHGQPQHINHGLTNSGQLRRQLDATGMPGANAAAEAALPAQQAGPHEI